MATTEAKKRQSRIARQNKNNIIGQLPLDCCLPPTEWRPTPVSDLPSWRGAKRIAIDTETKDPLLSDLGPGVRRGGKIIGVSFAIQNGPSHYLPIGHSSDNLVPYHVFEYLKDQSRDFDGEIVGANLSYDLDYLAEQGITFLKVKRFLDVQIAEPLIYELYSSYSLDAIAKRYGFDGKEEEMLRDAARSYYCDPKTGMWQLPGRFVGPYAIADVELPLAIIEKQLAIIKREELGRVFDLETRLLPVLVKMRRRGVRVDLKRLGQVEDWTVVQQRAIHEKIKSLSGVDLAMEDVRKAVALEFVLKKGISGVKIGRTKEGQPNIDKKFLLSLDHPLAQAIVKTKQLDKIRSDFAQSVRDHEINGRIHATFNQLRRSSDYDDDDEVGVRYGRLSCTDPNLQQQPGRDDDYDAKKKAGTLTDEDFHMGKLWRSIYLPEDGRKWAALDYSNQEPRLAVHYGEIVGCDGAKELADAWRANPDLNLHEKTSELTGLPKAQAKIIFLGRCYAMGGGKFARGLKLPTVEYWSKRFKRKIEGAGPEAQAIIDKFDAMVPWVKQLAKFCEDRGRDRGFVKTLLGRKLHFPKNVDPEINEEYDELHKALNKVIQGSAGDQTKTAMVKADEAGIVFALQVHDELDKVDGEEKDAEPLAEIMQTCIKLSVPTKVDVEVGDSWGDSM